MFNMKKSLIALAISTSALMPLSSYATTYNLGDITDSTATGDFSTVVFLGLVLDGGDTFNFSLNAADKSDLTLNISQLFGLNVGNSYFSLKQGATEISQINLAPLSLGSSNTYTFDNLSNGSYSLSLIPSNIIALNFGGKVSLSAASVVPVPEPETNALMMLGLGMIGLIARRKFA